MRVSLIGQAAFGEAVLKRLIRDGIEVVAASAPAPREGRRPDPLWITTSEAGLNPVDTVALKGEEGLSAWRSIDADLGIMAFVTELLPVEALTIPKMGTIQYHASLLPLHRGLSPMNWALINGRTETGVSIFWPNERLDRGPVLLQKRCGIGPHATYGSLYFDRLFPMGVNAIAEAVAMVEAGEAPRVEQDHAIATFEPSCQDEHARIPWYAPAQQVYNLIRGCNPEPGAWTMWRGERLGVLECRLYLRNEPGRYGDVLRIEGDGFDMRLNGGVLRVKRVQPPGERRIGADEWAAEVGLKVGDRFR